MSEEMTALGLEQVARTPGGAAFCGSFEDLMRANLWLRRAGRVLLRLGEARVTHLAQLDKWAHKLPWSEWLPQGAPLRIEASAKRSKLYHTGAIAQRVETAARAALGPSRRDGAALRIFARMEKDICQISLDTSGEPLHRRGAKLETGKAPMRETLAACFLAECGYRGEEPVLDPMCGSGSFILEAAEIACGLAPGRARPFAFENFACFDARSWEALLQEAKKARRPAAYAYQGFDRDAGAIRAAQANAERAGLEAVASFQQQAVSALRRPDGPSGLVIVNPPYGERIGDRKKLFALYQTLGEKLKTGFSGWRAAIVTSDPALAQASGLKFERPGPPTPHGPLKIRLYRTKALA